MIVNSPSTKESFLRGARLSAIAMLLLLATDLCLAQSSAQQTEPRSGNVSTLPATPSSIKQSFEAGEAALRAGELDRAEREFRKVIAADPRSAGAYANLGVINMRKKQWAEALRMLREADHLAPKVAGIRLNIGLVYYRQNNFRSAIGPFESVVRDQPDSPQARYLLGLCYFFTDRWSDAVSTLEPMWTQQWLNLSYLYVLGIAAHKSGNNALEDKALSRMVEIGENTPQFHLLMGKAFLNREEDDKAITELERAQQGDPTLPFLHFNLGLAYEHKQDYERAAEEFKKSIAQESDSPYGYEHLGDVDVALQHDDDATKNYVEALKLDPKMAGSLLGLAKIYNRQGRYHEALARLSAAEKLDPGSYDTHYLRGQILQKMGEREKAKTEFALYTRMMNEAREKRGRELSGEIPNPELTAEPQ
jgi:tetratricopeptide (TPR) repeat protein